MIALHVLASGSKGNASIVENTLSREGVLIDCGICKRDFFNGCESVGFDPKLLQAIFISHDHSDHTKGLGVVTRGLAKLGCTPPIYASHKVKNNSGHIVDVIEDGQTFVPMNSTDAFDIAGMQVRLFKTSHDAAESFGFHIEYNGPDGNDALAFMTDTGHVTQDAHESLQYVRILAIESNHDEKMLRCGPYPADLKRRVGSEKGHLSNSQAAEELESLLSSLGGSTIEHVVAMHISENNNTYSLPKQTLQKVVDKFNRDITVHVAYQKMVASIR